jgi:hypothetical protein
MVLMLWNEILKFIAYIVVAYMTVLITLLAHDPFDLFRT